MDLQRWPGYAGAQQVADLFTPKPGSVPGVIPGREKEVYGPTGSPAIATRAAAPMQIADALHGAVDPEYAAAHAPSPVAPGANDAPANDNGVVRAPPPQGLTLLGGGGGYVAPHMALTARSIQRGVQLPEQVTKDAKEARDAEMHALDLDEKSELETGRRARARGEAEASYLDTEQKAAGARALVRSQERGAAIAEKDRADRDADQKIDPDHYWNAKSTGAKIAGIIGLALGGFAAGFNHTSNQAYDALEKAIDRDIGAQKDNIAAKRGVAEGKRRDVEDLDRRQDRDVVHEARQRELGWRAVSATLDQIYPKVDDATKAKIDHMRANALARAADQGAKYAELTSDKVTEAQHLVGGGTGGAPAINQGLVVPVSGTEGVVFRSEKGAEDARKKMAAAQNIVPKLQSIRAMVAGASLADKANQWSEYHQNLDRALADVATDVNVYHGQGAMSEGDKLNTLESLGKLGGLKQFVGDQTHLVDQAIKGIHTSTNAMLNAEGGARVRIGTDQTGRAAAAYSGSLYQAPQGGGGPPRGFVPAGGR
jgi:hypothetical protein